MENGVVFISKDEQINTESYKLQTKSRFKLLSNLKWSEE